MNSVPSCIEIEISGFAFAQKGILEKNMQAVAKIAWEASDLEGNEIKISIHTDVDAKRATVSYSIVQMHPERHLFCFPTIYEILSEIQKLPDFANLEIEDFQWNGGGEGFDYEYTSCYVEVQMLDSSEVRDIFSQYPGQLFGDYKIIPIVGNLYLWLSYLGKGKFDITIKETGTNGAAGGKEAVARYTVKYRFLTEFIQKQILKYVHRELNL